MQVIDDPSDPLSTIPWAHPPMIADRRPLPIHFGNRLRACRNRADISQEALGEMTALHRTEIELLERGEREPRLSTIIKLASALDVPLHELVGEIGWEHAHAGAGEFEFRNLRDVAVV
jgi:transcriptional regulator with XRE-family HTH domain